jgi:hypothetical protein
MPLNQNAASIMAQLKNNQYGQFDTFVRETYNLIKTHNPHNKSEVILRNTILRDLEDAIGFSYIDDTDANGKPKEKWVRCLEELKSLKEQIAIYFNSI